MGLNISKLLDFREIRKGELKGKKIAIDTYIFLHQFIHSMPELSNRFGKPTSHLSGLFYRTISLIEMGIQPCFVFDGPFLPVGQKKIIQPRLSSTITEYVLEESKKLLGMMGLPVIQAPSDGEAQASCMSKEGDVWAAASQDYDCLMYCAKRLLLNLRVAKTRKLPTGGKIHTGTYLVELDEVLKSLGISHEQFIALAMLAGTDFHPGVKGIGQKKALKLVKEHGTDFARMFKEAGWNFSEAWQDVFSHIVHMPVEKHYSLHWKKPDEKALIDFLVKENDFSRERVENALRRMQ